jgi:hypothetical protein
VWWLNTGGASASCIWCGVTASARASRPRMSDGACSISTQPPITPEDSSSPMYLRDYAIIHTKIIRKSSENSSENHQKIIRKSSIIHKKIIRNHQKKLNEYHQKIIDNSSENHR